MTALIECTLMSLDGALPPLTLTGTRELASGVVILNYVVGSKPEEEA